MFRPFVLLMITGCALAMPAAAQAPAPTTTFDGVYADVSREVSVYTQEKRCPPISGVPQTLTITNGVARTAVGWEGTVNPQAGLVMRTPRGLRYDGQIDPHGTIRAQGSGTRCTFTYSWQRQSR